MAGGRYYRSNERWRRARTAAFAIAISLMIPVNVSAETELVVATSSSAFVGNAQIGRLDVAGVGPVRFEATRDGPRIVVNAIGANRQMLGRAELTAGLRETPLYIRVNGKLEKIVIRWGAEGANSGRQD